MSQTALRAGAHMSIANGFLAATQKAVEEYGANTMQFFLKSPRGRGVTKLTPEDAQAVRAYMKGLKGDFYRVAHASYLLNLAKPLSDSWPLDSLVADLRSMDLLGGQGVVLHVGKTLELPYEEAEGHLVENLQRVLDKTKVIDVPILLENTAGQGTEMGYRFEQLASLFEKLGRPKRVRFCLDTCHAFAAGYDMRTAAGVKAMLNEWDQVIGITYLDAIHFNDSLKPLGSRVDRHQNLGEGFIGREGLTTMAEWAMKQGLPLILETPEKERSHLEDLTILRGWLS